jgi:carbon monoxide dehydrogenase subunit G
MIRIEVDTQTSIAIAAPAATVFAFVRDVRRAATYFPGIDKTEALGDGLYRYKLTERRTLGKTFAGEYIARYVENGHTIVWSTTEGNMRSDGVWKVEGNDEQARLLVQMQTSFDESLPALLKRPISLFVRVECQKCLETQLASIKKVVEAEHSAAVARGFSGGNAMPVAAATGAQG